MPLSAREVENMAAPKRWRWTQRPKSSIYGMEHGVIAVEGFEDVSLSDYGLAMSNMVKWLTRLNADYGRCNAFPVTYGWIANQNLPGGRGRAAKTIQVYFGDPFTTKLFTPVIKHEHERCPCGQTQENGQTRCKCGRYFFCANCSGVGLAVYWSQEEETFFCVNCVRRCRQQEVVRGQFERCHKIVNSHLYLYCREHGNRQQCAGNCGQEYEGPRMLPRDDRPYCENCYALVCPECNAFDAAGLVMSEILGVRVCHACFDTYAGATKNEKFDKAEFTSSILKLEKHRLRPVRICSLEIECGGPGGTALARELSAAQLSPHNAVQPHWASNRQVFDPVCHVEKDSSLGQDGGELIFHKLQLDTEEDVANLYKGMGIVRRQITNGKLSMDMRCGLHVHIDAHRFGIGHVRNLVLLFNYLEDPIYRLASAGYSKHRGTGYAAKIGKGPYRDKNAFAGGFFGTNAHSSALNVSNYWKSIRGNCACGASVVGEHEKCTCNLGKCTFEFRVWNGTSSIRKLAAYVALSQSLVAYARMFDHDLDEADFPICEYHTGVKVTEGLMEEWRSRLMWMFKNLYFSPTERDNIHYAIRESDLSKMGTHALQEIEAVRYVEPPVPDVEEVKVAVRGQAPQPVDPYDRLLRDQAARVQNQAFRFPGQEQPAMWEPDFDELEEF